MVEQRFRVAVVIERSALANRWVSEVWRPARIELEVQFGDAGTPEMRTGEAGTSRGTPQLLPGQEPCGNGEGAPSFPPSATAPSAREYWRWPGFDIEVHRSEAEGYYLNTSAREPRAFVMWRMEDGRGIPVLVTVSYSEAARWLDGGAEVEAVGLPSEIRAYLDAWVAANYRPEPKKKARRNDPFREGAFRRDAK